MPISDHQMIESWREVLRLSNLEEGQIVTILTSVATHPQTLQTAKIAAQSMGAIVSQFDLPPVNGEKAFSRDALAYLGTTPLTGNRAAIAALTESDLVLDLMTLLFLLLRLQGTLLCTLLIFSGPPTSSAILLCLAPSLQRML